MIATLPSIVSGTGISFESLKNSDVHYVSLPQETRDFLDLCHRGGDIRHVWQYREANHEQSIRKQTRSLWFPGDEPIRLPLGHGAFDNYFTVHPLGSNALELIQSATDPRYVSSRTRYIKGINCLFADFDLKSTFPTIPQDDLLTKRSYYMRKLEEQIQLLPFLPTRIVRSSGIGLHCYWFFDEFQPISDENRHQIAWLQKCWVEYVTADTGAHDLRRLLRIPGVSGVPSGLKNHKYNPPQDIVFDESILEGYGAPMYRYEDLYGVLIEYYGEPQARDYNDSAYKGVEWTSTRIEELLEGLDQSRVEDREDWLRVGMSLRFLGREGFDHWDRWSQTTSIVNQYPGETALRYQWDSLQDTSSINHPIGIGTLISMYRQDRPDSHIDWLDQFVVSVVFSSKSKQSQLAERVNASQGKARAKQVTYNHLMTQLQTLPEGLDDKGIHDYRQEVLLIYGASFFGWNGRDRAALKIWLVDNMGNDWVRSTFEGIILEEARKEYEDMTKVKANEDTYRIFFQVNNWKIELNVLTDRVELNRRPFSDPFFSRCFITARESGLGSEKLLRSHFESEAFDHSYHPVQERLSGLVRQDPRDIFQLLGQYFQTTAPDVKYEDGSSKPLIEIYLKKWCLGAVGRAFDSQIQNPVLLLNGPQGLGKSYFTRWLGSIFPSRYYRESTIHPEDKDYLLYLASTFIWEVPEFGRTVRRADMESLKGYLTTALIEVRPAYGRYQLALSPMASFVGTVNDAEGILVDSTGSRRFRPITLTNIDHNYSKALGVTEVWAQAMELYRQGERPDFTSEEKLIWSDVSEEFKLMGPVEEVLSNYFDFDPNYTDRKHDGWAMVTDEVYDLVGTRLKMAITQNFYREVGRGVKRFGGKKTAYAVHGKYWFYGIRLKESISVTFVSGS